MSVIVAKSTFCCGGIPPSSTYCIPAVSISKLVTSGTTLSIDGLNTSQWRAIKWHVIVTTLSASKTKGYEIYATHRNGNNPHFNQYAIIGDRIFAQTPNVIISGGQLTLQLTNNETEDVMVYVTRLAVPIIQNVVEILPRINITDITTVVSGGATDTIDWLLSPEMTASKWYITVTDGTGKRSISQVFGLNMDGTPSVDSTRYGWTGDTSLKYNIDANLVNVLGFGLQLVFTNNDTVPYRVDISRLPIHVIPEIEFPPTCNTNTAPSLSIWNPLPVIIPAGSTMVVDNTVNLPGHQGVKWLIGTLENITNNSMAFEVACTQTNLTTSYNVTYGYIGDYIDLVVSTAIVGSSNVLSITNNQSNSITVNMARIPVSL